MPDNWKLITEPKIYITEIHVAWTPWILIFALVYGPRNHKYWCSVIHAKWVYLQMTGHWWTPADLYIRYMVMWISLKWWRHDMETFSALLALCGGIYRWPMDFPLRRPVTWSFNVSLVYARKTDEQRVKSPWFETLRNSCHATVIRIRLHSHRLHNAKYIPWNMYRDLLCLLFLYYRSLRIHGIY